MKKISRSFWILMICGLIFSGTVYAAVKPLRLEYDRGLVSMKSQNMSLAVFLEYLAGLANMEIYVIEKLSNDSYLLEFDRVPVQEVLNALLDNYNYAVIYLKGWDNGSCAYILDESSGVRSVKKVSLDQVADIVLGNTEKAAGNGIADLAVPESIGGKSEIIRIPQAKGGGSMGLGYTPADKITEKIIGSIPSKGDTALAGSPSPSPVTQGGTFTIRRILNGGGTTDTGSGYASTGYGSSSVITGTASPGTEASDLPVSDGVFQEDGSSASISDNSSVDGTGPAESGTGSPYSRAKDLENRISELEKFIDSGGADRFYSLWTAKKSPKYVYNPWNELDKYQKELELLRVN